MEEEVEITEEVRRRVEEELEKRSTVGSKLRFLRELVFEAAPGETIDKEEG